ncbi:DNA-directed RNA polymerase [Echria macrotheca]|uniref:DNA-directed RNA polymerase n=1 Tax=Echria macrotheca TaxID=438768 RepID=A0AAJ0B7L5_9PEZI|nr:DNA-directed RNA polymerase [Echria macrotheca]
MSTSANDRHESHDDDDDDDPIVASYNVFIKPGQGTNRKVVTLDFHTITSHDPSQLRAPKIAEFRVKQKEGMYELDVPVDTSESYDKRKGVKWGTALQKSTEARNGASLGLAGGFGVGGTGSRAAAAAVRGRAAGDQDGDVPTTWEEAQRLDRVIRTRTFTGIAETDEALKYYVGVFQGKNIHLSPVAHNVVLRPVQPYIDAATEQEKQEKQARLPPGATGPGGGADKPPSRAITMTIKSAMDGVTRETMADRLHAVQVEPWQQIAWYHDETQGAWDVYRECLLLHPDDKGKNVPEGENCAAGGAADLVDKVPKLRQEESDDASKKSARGGGTSVFRSLII